MSIELNFIVVFCLLIFLTVCETNKFSCDENAKCLPLTWVCDSINDCKDNTDEHNCPQRRTGKEKLNAKAATRKLILFLNCYSDLASTCEDDIKDPSIHPFNTFSCCIIISFCISLHASISFRYKVDKCTITID